jgi:uncharacterized protein (DUF488 family)
MSDAGVKYVYLGTELGGRPDADEFYDDDGHVCYDRVARSPIFLGGLERLERGIRRFRVAVMCSEEDPKVCHRFRLISRVLAQRGTEVRHIRGDGSIQTDAELRVTEFTQSSLFDAAEDASWKSLQSVSRRKRPRSSSDSSAATESDGSSTCD